MRKVKVEQTKPKKTRHTGWFITTQLIEDCILVLNIYNNKILQARHCINVLTGEYATLKGKIWSVSKIETALGFYKEFEYYYCSNSDLKERGRMSEEDERYIKDTIRPDYYFSNDPAVKIISRKETQYQREKREITEMNRLQKVKETMDKVPEIPAGILSWIDKKETGNEDVCLKVGKEKKWSCSACGNKFEQSHLINVATGQKARDKDMIICPECGKEIRLYTRKKRIESLPHFILMQPIDEDISVARHFSADICCLPGKKKSVSMVEEVRIILYKNKPMAENKKTCTIYYEQYNRPYVVVDDNLPIRNKGNFDNKSNPANKREYMGYLYDGGIEEALKRTVYEPWTKLFREMSTAGLCLNYNAMMCGVYENNYIQLMEMLFRGRFMRLLQEESYKISYWTGAYYGDFRLSANYIEDVFGLADRQKINRIRDKNGGNLMLEWMRWSDRNRQKISDKALSWLLANGIVPENMAWMKCRFTVEQAMNYIERQRKEQYKKKSVKQVINQYEDYMSMCEKLHKDTTDEMVYRPRELKRRHDEAVADIERQNAQLKAEEYSVKFSEAEKVLGKIKDKFAYDGEKYFIKVPERIVDIVAEGNYLHHCAGATERYFDRIKSNETYICFLRKVEEPDIPYYTIEVEPGGTIRQHRGMYDEEPEFEQVKPFLKEWQQVIRKRMTDKDHKLAADSKIKREENIAELKAKNNTRVLNGLMEDFMEAI